MKLFCIADEDTVRGFRLAGVPGRPARDEREAARAMEEVLRQPDIGLVLLTGEVADRIREVVDAHRLSRSRPLLVEIPGPPGTPKAGLDLRRIVQSAVGIGVGTEEEP